MNEDEIMEKYLAENQERPECVNCEIIADIMLYKSLNIKAHIPAWVFDAAFSYLRSYHIICENAYSIWDKKR